MFIATVWGVSDSFNFTLDSGEDSLDDMGIYVEDGSVYIGSTSDALSGQIQDDGSIKLDDDLFIGITKNYFTVVNSTVDTAVKFSINKKGRLEYNGEKKFKAIPSGDTNVWILASSDATSSLSSAYDIKIKCEDSKGDTVDAFGNFGSKATVQYGVLISSLLFAIALSF